MAITEQRKREQQRREGTLFLAIGYLLGFTIIYFAIYVWYLTSRRKWMKGKEHGSARWGKTREGKRLQSRVFRNNIILTQTERLNLKARKIKKKFKVLGIGNSGLRRSQFFVTPNFMKINTYYVITDPKAEPANLSEDYLLGSEKILREQSVPAKDLELQLITPDTKVATMGER